MPYIDRDNSGNVVGIYANSQREGQEFAESAELLVDQKEVLRVQINAIEFSKLTSRNTREALIYLAEKEAMEVATALGATPQQVLLANVGYQTEKAVDLQIAALRAQIQALG